MEAELQMSVIELFSLVSFKISTLLLLWTSEPLLVVSLNSPIQIKI